MKKIIFVGNARDFHAMDWYRTIKKVCVGRDIIFATDLVCSEGHTKLVTDNDSLAHLYNIDHLLFSNQSHVGNIWRNIVKVLVFPIQVKRLKQLAAKHPSAVYHAHTMYYLFVCWLARLKYIGSPQGDEILIRPYRSRLYKYFAVKSLKASDHLIVDSVNLKKGILSLSGKDASVIQYGIDVEVIKKNVDTSEKRTKVASIRALYPLYRISEILDARNRYDKNFPITLFYPFWEDAYKEKIVTALNSGDSNLGRIPKKEDMFKVLSSVLLAISIPESDSSPRSVYESIFCGCCVAVTYNPWIESLPECMRSRVIVVDINDNLWLEKAIKQAKEITKEPFNPSEKALNLFDQERSMKQVADHFYK